MADNESREKEILKVAKERFLDCEKVWAEYIEKQQELVRFISGEQWTYVARQNFEQNGFAAITSNRLPTFLRQITNELRKNTPSIQIDPKDDGTVDTAEVINDLIRNIELDSKADVAYIKAADSAASVGIGYIRVMSKYESDKSMEQKIVIDPIMDSSTVMLDPHHLAVDGSDCEYAFITTVISKDEYKRRYGDSELAELMTEVSWSPANRAWVTKDEVMIAEYFFKDYDAKTLYQYYNTLTGETITDFYEDKKELKALVDNGAIIIQDQRDVNVPIVRWLKINDLEILEESVWPGPYIPIVPVKGDEFWVEGKRKLVGAVEPAVDAQVMLNYNLSMMAQLIQMAPKAPYIGTATQFKTYEQQWANINVSNQAFLPYNKDEGAGPPQRDLQEVQMNNLSMLVQQSTESLQQIFGTFDPSQSQVAPESGKAILARQNQAYNSNYHFYDNLARSIQHVGAIIVDALPTLYSNPRTVQASKLTGEKRSVKINMPGENGMIEHDLTKGEYQVSIQTGASFGTRRQEAVVAITQIMGLSPAIAQNMADLAIINMDIPGAKEAAARARAMVDPNVLAAASAGQKMEPEQVVQQLKQQLQALQQKDQAHTMLGEQLVQENKMLKQENELEKHNKQVEITKAELDYKLKNRQMDINEAEIELQTRLDIMKLKLEERQLDIKAEEVASDISSDMMEHSHKKAKHGLEERKHEASVADVVSDSEIDSGVSDLGGKINSQ